MAVVAEWSKSTQPTLHNQLYRTFWYPITIRSRSNSPWLHAPIPARQSPSLSKTQIQGIKRRGNSQQGRRSKNGWYSGFIYRSIRVLLLRTAVLEMAFPNIHLYIYIYLEAIKVQSFSPKVCGIISEPISALKVLIYWTFISCFN